MKKIILSAVCCLTLLSAMAGRWPDKPLGGGEKLFFDERTFAEIRERIDSYPWAADLYEKLRHNIAHPTPLVEYAPLWGESLRIKDAALYYRISGDESYIPEIVENIVKAFSLDRAGDKPLFADKAKGNPNLWTWLMYRGGLFVAYDLIRNHPQMIPHVPAMERRLDEIIAETQRMASGLRQLNNTHFWAVTMGLGVAGFLRGNDEAIAQAVYNKTYGLTAMLKKFRDGGRFLPEPFRYGYDYVACCMTILAEAFRFNGREDLYRYEVTPNGASMKKMIEAYFTVICPDGSAPVNGDMGELVQIAHGREYREIPRLFHNQNTYRVMQKLEIYHAVFRTPALAWAISKNPARDEVDFTFWGYAALTHGASIDNAQAPDARSVVWPETGDAHLKSIEGPAYWDGDAITVHVRNGATLATHNHNDYFHFTLNAFGKNIYPDWFYRWDYLAPRSADGYANQTPFSTRMLGHNTVIADFTEPSRKNIVYSQIVRDGGAQVFSASGEIYDGIRQQRTFVMAPEYVIDIFQVQSETPHTYDYVLHSFGSATYDGVAGWRPYPAINDDYGLEPIDSRVGGPESRWIGGARKAAVADNVTVRFLDRDGIGCYTSVVQTGDSEVIAGAVPYYIAPTPKGWKDTPRMKGMPRRKPMFILRRKACNTTFYALHQPFRKGGPRFGFSLDGNRLVVRGDRFTDTYDLGTGRYEREKNN